MKSETYKIWELIANDPSEFDFGQLHNKSNKLTILLRKFTTHEFLKIEFSGILTYRYTIEGGRFKTINKGEMVGVFLTSTNSEYYEWFKEESGSTFDDWSLKHVVICCSDCIIDTITNEVPKIEWENELQ